MGFMCDAVKKAEIEKAPYPFFAVNTKPGSAVFFWHWTQTAHGQVPDWHEGGWHGGCPSEGDRYIIRSFLHRPELNCKHDNPDRHPSDHSTWRSECLASPFTPG